MTNKPEPIRFSMKDGKPVKDSIKKFSMSNKTDEEKNKEKEKE